MDLPPARFLHKYTFQQETLRESNNIGPHYTGFGEMQSKAAAGA